MNFKRKLWWAQHRTDVYKYSTFILLFLIVTISIIYFTYSKFSTSNEMTMYETTVEPFINNDYFIASYIDGEWSNEITGKNDGYIIDKVVCDNGATGTWDYNNWEIRISNATKKTKCSLFFVTGSLIDVELFQGLISVTYNSSGNVQVASSGFNASSLPDSKYYDLYEYQAEDGIGYTRYRLGDATREVLKNTSSNGTNAWWGDYSCNIYSSYPWLYRGGTYYRSSDAGVFQFDRNNGGSYANDSFRSVITAY